LGKQGFIQWRGKLPSQNSQLPPKKKEKEEKREREKGRERGAYIFWCCDTSDQ
jgi:hypothetical protein